MATAATLKPFGGTFLVPGVSLNRRLYTKELIGKAVARMRERLADPDGLPIVMRTFHGAGDDSRLITARVVAVNQESDGRGTYQARWYDTAPARDIAELVRPADGGLPGLRTVSIFGYFLGPEQTLEVDGEQVTTAPDLEVDAIDFTATPGVVKALVASGESARPVESTPPAGSGRVAISETWEVFVAGMTEQAPEPALPTPAEPAAVTPVIEAMVDEKYTAQQKRDALASGQAMKNPDGDPAYIIKTKGDLRKAIKAVGRGGADHDAIRKHVMARAKALGLTFMIPDAWNADGSLKESAERTRLGEIRECYSDSYGDTPVSAGFAIDAYNGPLSITLRAPSISPADLRVIATAAMAAACDALQALDPDMDADIDVPGAPAEDTDIDLPPDDGEPEDEIDTPSPGAGCPCGCGCSVPHQMAGGPGCPCPCGDCEVCNSAAGPAAESAPAPTPPPAPQPPQSSAPPAAVESAPTAEESAMSETETTAAQAATTPLQPAVPAVVPAAAPTTPAPALISMTQEAFNGAMAAAATAAANVAVTALLAARPAPAAEAAPAAPAPAPVPAPVAPAAVAVVPAAEAAPAVPTLTADAVGQAVNAALKAQLPNILTAYGLPPRRGFRTTETDTEKELTPTELWDKRADLLLGSGFGQ